MLRRLKRIMPKPLWAKLLAIPLYFTLVIVIGYFCCSGILYIHGHIVLNSVLADLNAKEPDWTREAIEQKRAKVPNGENAYGVFEAISRQIEKAPPEAISELNIMSGARLVSEHVDRPVSSMTIVMIKPTRDETRQLMNQIVQLKDYTRGYASAPERSQLYLSLEPPDHARWLNIAHTVLTMSGLIACQEGDDRHMTDCLRAMMNISSMGANEINGHARHLSLYHRDETITFVVNALGNRIYSEEMLQELQKAMHQLGKENMLPIKARLHRAEMADVFVKAIEEGYSSVDDETELSYVLINRAYSSAFRRQDYATFLKATSGLIKVIEGPEHEIIDAYRKFYFNTIVTFDFHLRYPLSYASLIDWQDIEKELNILARARAMEVGIACERYRLRNGEWPDELGDIPEQLLQDLPNDPFTGRPLNYRRDKQGILIYSTGWNREDNDGSIYQQSRYSDPRDVGIRVWNLHLRSTNQQ